MSHHAVISYTSADGEHAGEVEVNENVILVANSENPRVEITTCHRSLVDHITIIPVTLNEETALVKTIFYLPDDDFIQSTLPTDE